MTDEYAREHKSCPMKFANTNWNWQTDMNCDGQCCMWWRWNGRNDGFCGMLPARRGYEKEPTVYDDTSDDLK